MTRRDPLDRPYRALLAERFGPPDWMRTEAPDPGRPWTEAEQADHARTLAGATDQVEGGEP
jgi:hypothetical protein